MDHRPIGFFDSGMGGITVLEEALQVLPNENYVYFGDTKNAPYGDKAPQEVLALCEAAFSFLLEKGCKAIVIACNTATGVAAETLRRVYGFPIIGIEPALKPASLHPGEGRIIVMATQVALSTPKFQRLMEQYGQDAFLLPCPGLMECVEKGELSGPSVDALLDKLLAPCAHIPVKAVVLGCTHYPFLKKTIEKHFPPETPFFDGAYGTARQLKRRLEEADLLSGEGSGEIAFYASEPEKSDQMERMARAYHQIKEQI